MNLEKSIIGYFLEKQSELKGLTVYGVRDKLKGYEKDFDNKFSFYLETSRNWMIKVTCNVKSYNYPYVLIDIKRNRIDKKHKTYLSETTTELIFNEFDGAFYNNFIGYPEHKDEITFDKLLKDTEALVTDSDIKNKIAKQALEKLKAITKHNYLHERSMRGYANEIINIAKAIESGETTAEEIEKIFNDMCLVK